MIPVPEVRELNTVPAEFLPLEPVRVPSPLAGVLPAGAEIIGTGALLRFKSMMAAEGQHVHLSRMCYDRLYAYERIAVAHAGGHPELRRLALELFQILHSQSTAGLRAQ